MLKICALFVRDNEYPLYHEINEKFGFDITYYGNVDLYDESLYQGMDAVVNGNPTTKLSDDYFAMLKRNNISIFVAKMTGVGQIDMEAAKRQGVMVANVQSYSPNAIAELGIGMAMAMNRHLFEMQVRNQKLDFFNRYTYFREIRDSVVGILGVGKIGATSAKLFAGMGAKVIGYDPRPYADNESFMQYVDLETLQKESDILLVHTPYIQGVNYHLVGADFIANMKSDALIINMARGELVDLASVNKAIKENKLGGFGTDVLENEYKYFGKQLEEIEDETVREALELYPRVIISPHVGANTYRARYNMIEIALQEVKDLNETGNCLYRLI